MKELTLALDRIGSTVILLFRSCGHFLSIPKQVGRILEQCFLMGYGTFPIVAILSFFIGAVLALQTGFSLSSLAGAQSFLGGIVGLSVCRELAPVMTSFLVAGRVGSAITAEIASMKVYQEIDALKTMNIKPECILVMPRLVAILLMMPVLAILSVIIGWYGGMIVSDNVDFISLDPSVYWRALRETVTFDSIKDGLIKAEIFGFLVVLISCNEGLRTRGGPREVGVAVTRAVVFSMISILFLDYFVTKILL